MRIACLKSAQCANRTQIGGFKHISKVITDVMLDLESAVTRNGGFRGDVLPAQKPLSRALDRIEVIRQAVDA